MELDRRAGILLHPTSLPGPGGIGTVGGETVAWLDWLVASGCSVWQVLPLGPTGYGDSPYQSLSSHAGNPLLIDLNGLVTDGLLRAAEIDGAPGAQPDRVDFGALIPWKRALLDAAHSRLGNHHALRSDFDAFVTEEAAWLDDFTLFRALKDSLGGRPWHEWPPPIRDRAPAAMADAARTLAAPIERHAFAQWVFSRQWSGIRAAAASRGIRIFGDIPLYVAQDSADVWANRRLFALDDAGRAIEVAGVPPDYFSPTGQLWGNPIYRWEAHAATGYGWWIERVRAALRAVDIVRLDHFRGLADYWAIPATAPTAETGEWRLGPGRAFFDALEAVLGDLPIVAEDLGDLSPAVDDLRDELGVPGMKILQFAFDGDPDNPFLPEHIERRAVVYTGTHDNDTTIGWFASVDARERRRVIRHMRGAAATIHWALIDTAWSSEAFLAIAPLQDVLGLPGSERMNTPGVASGNWRWRALPGAFDQSVAARLRALTEATGRLPAGAARPAGDASAPS